MWITVVLFPDSRYCCGTGLRGFTAALGLVMPIVHTAKGLASSLHCLVSRCDLL